jgi:Flp pilus assembly protein TadD/predicted Zn-dependent protease with MMP-like domain
MDQLSAYLDRGWELVQKGDLRGARASARRALETDRNSPEAHNLLGYVAAQEGDADEALEHYRQAMALDDGYIDPMLNAAEVLIHPLREWDEAIELCDEVLDFAEGQEETADALLLKFDALVGKGDRDAARAVLDQIPEGPFEGPVYPFLIGRALYEVGEIERAEAHLRKAVEADPRNPDAHYYLGLVADDRRDTRSATLSFLEARELDLATAPPPWALPREGFQKVVERALGQVDPQLMAHLENALVLVADAPGMEVVADGVDPRVPVLFEGVSRPGEPGPLAARVFVYQRNIERLCGGIEQLEDEIAYQLSEEIKHTLTHREHESEGKPAPRTAAAEGVRSRDRERERERDRDSKPDDEAKPSTAHKRS